MKTSEGISFMHIASVVKIISSISSSLISKRSAERQQIFYSFFTLPHECAERNEKGCKLETPVL